MFMHRFITWITWTGNPIPRNEDYLKMFRTDKEKENALYTKMYQKVRKVAMYGIKQYMRKSVEQDRVPIEFGVNLDYFDFIPSSWKNISVPTTVAKAAFNRCITDIRRELGQLGYFTLSDMDSPTSKYVLMIFLSRETFIEHIVCYCTDQLNCTFNPIPVVRKRLANVIPDQSVIWKSIVECYPKKASETTV